MEITDKYMLTTKCYGSTPAKGYLGVLDKYIKDKVDESLLTFAQQNLKKGQEIENMVEDILSIFHRDADGYPCIGNWMVQRSLRNTGLAIFNAAKNPDQPSKQKIPICVTLVEPYLINFVNRKVVTKPDGVDTYAVTITDPKTGKARSFFKAYEYVNRTAQMEITIHFDDDLVTEELALYWIQKAGLVGVGAYRERFGKFMKMAG